MSEAQTGLRVAGQNVKSGQGSMSVLTRLGPGLITGAADDDPSGIATYSQVGARFGFSMLWTMLFSFPLMAAVQEICARLGRITGVGIGENLRRNYSKPVVYGVVLLLCVANVFNLGADLSAMGAAARLIFGGPAAAYVVLLGSASLLLQIYVPYRKYARFLKTLTLVLFAYVAAAFVVHVPWAAALRATVIPSVSLSSAYWTALIAVLGTTISPYLFFWQSSQEAEEVGANKREFALKRRPSQAFAQLRRIATDTKIGMAFSNIVAFFIILITAVTLKGSGTENEIQTAADAAKALQPLAGRFASGLFGLGIVGTGLLAVPVLAASAAYAVAEVFRWRASLDKKPRQAPKFYLLLSLATVIGIAFEFAGVNPIRALYLAAVVNGIAAGPVMCLLMLLSRKRAVVGEFVLPTYLRNVGWFATGTMVLAFLGFLVSTIAGLH